MVLFFLAHCILSPRYSSKRLFTKALVKLATSAVALGCLTLHAFSRRQRLSLISKLLLAEFVCDVFLFTCLLLFNSRNHAAATREQLKPE